MSSWLQLLIVGFGLVCYVIGRLHGAKWQRDQDGSR